LKKFKSLKIDFIFLVCNFETNEYKNSIRVFVFGLM
jgi:hypothetical protein